MYLEREAAAARPRVQARASRVASRARGAARGLSRGTSRPRGWGHGGESRDPALCTTSPVDIADIIEPLDLTPYI